MTSLLSIQSSPRGADSLSRALSRQFVQKWREKHEGGTVIERDLTVSYLPFVSLPWIEGIFTSIERQQAAHQEALKVSDELIAEVFAANHILIGTPMYNFAVPANLKAWIDMIVRPKVTHSGPPERKGLVTGKQCTVIIASGGVYEQGLPAAASDFESGYLKRILGFLGITDVEVVLAGGTAAAAFGSTTIEQLAQQHGPAVAATVR